MKVIRCPNCGSNEFINLNKQRCAYCGSEFEARHKDVQNPGVTAPTIRQLADALWGEPIARYDSAGSFRGLLDEMSVSNT